MYIALKGGQACHLGVLTGIPTIGIGKTFLLIDGLTIATVKQLEKTLKKGGDAVDLVGESGTTWASVIHSFIQSFIHSFTT
jgi:deoxyinosine 3'endonuclease (endonuclease V)